VAGEVVDFRRNAIAVDIEAPADGVVVVHESYYPHWSATVDGEPARIVPANGQYRGVLVGPGRHLIEMTYRPPGWRLLALLNPLALAAAIALCAWERRRARRATAR
jgi:uncharacterized membrane protein YfhO